MSADHKRNMGLRERKKAKTIATVQRHALRLFQEQGYKATTVEQIAEAAEISYSTFFRYFSSKEDVLVVDNYDPLLVAAFEEQPAHLSPLQALRNAMISEMTDMSPDELTTMRQRNELVMTVPELRAALMNNMTQMLDLIAEMLAKRTGREPDDLALRTLAGAVIGINISMMLYYAEHPESDFPQMLDKALSQLESGLTL